MKKILRYAILVIAVAGATAASATMAMGQQAEILKRLDSYNRNLSTLRANLAMIKFNPQLNTTDTLIGSIILVQNCKSKKRCFRLDWKTENGRAKEESVSVIADDYELYTGGAQNRVVFGKVNKTKNSPQAGNALAFMSMTKAELKSSYDFTYIGQERLSSGREVWHLELTPKVATSYKAAEIWVDTDGMPRQTKIVEKNGDTTTVLLTNDVTNEKVNLNVFKINYPSNAKRVRG